MFIILGGNVKAQTKHFIGEKFGGGIVFQVSTNGLHGLISETIDQGSCTGDNAAKIAKNGIHSMAGKAFNDWRLPTKEELNKLYLKKKIIGGFMDWDYWSSSSGGTDIMWTQSFYDGSKAHLYTWAIEGNVRAVRIF